MRKSVKLGLLVAAVVALLATVSCFCLITSTWLTLASMKPSRRPRKDFAGNLYHQGWNPILSPDGYSVVFSSPGSGNGDICKLDTTDGNRTILLGGPEYEGCPWESPGGDLLAFAREQAEGRCDLWLMDTRSLAARQFTRGGNDDEPSFSPSGRSLVFTRVTGRDYTSREIYTASIPEGALQRLTVKEEGDSLASYSPDGSRIIFRRGFNDIWIMDSDGSNDRRLGLGYSAVFAPDGKTIFFVGDPSGQAIYQICRTDDEFRTTTATTNFGNYKSGLRICPDGKSLGFVEEPIGKSEGTFYQIDFNGIILKIVSLY